MVDEIAQGIYRIGVPLPGNPLKEVNCYFVRGDESDLLIDTGFRSPICEKVLRNGLAELGSDIRRRNVLATHVHSDHSGMVDKFAGKDRNIYMSAIDLDYQKRYQSGELSQKQLSHYISEGFPADLGQLVFDTGPERHMSSPVIDERFQGLNDGDAISVGHQKLRFILTPGHTPGSGMFYLENQRAMFTGDHILFDISPNITAWETMDDALGEYLHSLRQAKQYHVELALPGHRKTGNYHERIDALLQHHERRLREAQKIIAECPGLTAYEITARMTWKIRARSWTNFPIIQRWFAVGECISHLDYLRIRGMVYRENQVNTWRYYPL